MHESVRREQSPPNRSRVPTNGNSLWARQFAMHVAYNRADCVTAVCTSFGIGEGPSAASRHMVEAIKTLVQFVILMAAHQQYEYVQLK
jgi:hypothetical protein